ncbi:MAG: D-alanyl-D-alanine carboxypeptidase [Deltaproteobacteria bacterium]|nr:D-alanyl-D-alanine carboxypeptidase [Deltaproteobacteria bacterium]
MRTLAALGATMALLGVLVGPTSANDLPDVRSKSVVVLDSDTGAELYGKDADEVRPIASTTKIFVAMAVRANKIELDAYTEITRADAKESRGGARTRLDVGERFKNRDLLRAMLMSSDNRAPTALGRGAGLDSDQLVAAMNKVAKQLHLKRTRFTHPSGLRGNVSTAREMAIALRAALEDPVLRDIMHDDFETIYAKGRTRKGIGYGTTNAPLVSKRYDVIGGKTGYTKPAGYCFITAAKFGGREVLTVFLGAPSKPSRFEDFNKIAAWLDRGAPGAKIATKRPPRAKPRLDVDARGRVANP